MRFIIALLSALFTGLEIVAQILLAPLTLLTVAGLVGFTALMGRQVRLESWRKHAAWKKAA